MTRFHAQPYDLSASGFFFETPDEYRAKLKAARNSFGDPVEEFEIQFIDGEAIDYAVCNALGLYQSNIIEIMEKLNEWSESKKTHIIIGAGECGISFDVDHDDPESVFDITIYEAESYKDLAYQFVEEGLFGDIPEYLENYIDYDAIARDLRFDYSDLEIDGVKLIYRCH